MNDRELLEAIRADLSQLKNLLTGNGTPEKGLIVRVDRLEQAEASRSRWIGAALTTAISAAVMALWNLVFKVQR